MWRRLVDARSGLRGFYSPAADPNHGSKKGEITLNDSNRVLSRAGARELSAEDVELVSGGFVHTNVITFNPFTGARDGDGYVMES
jgi:hypothetical protein